jgi:hypothetical protein
MATVSSRLILVGLAAATLGACAPDGSYTPYAMPPSAFGEALKYDMAVQTIDPDPVYPAGAAEAGTNGDAARAAAERYRKGQVKAVERESTTQTTSGGAGSGSR